MLVYVVTYESAYGEVIDKIFCNEEKANAYCAKQNKESGGIWCYEVKPYEMED
jgi:hypothetical protein